MIGTYHGARIWCNLDGCGIICAMATWAMLSFAVYVVSFVLLRVAVSECISLARLFTAIAFLCVAALAATAHIRTMLTDPGAVPRHASPLPDPLEIMETGEVDEDQGEDKETSRLTSRMELSDGAAAGGGAAGGGAAGGGAAGAGDALGAGGQLDAPNNSVTDEVVRSTRQTPVKWCHKCDAFKPPRAHHCSLCQRCIVKMDHHCPWVNNCVGIRNQKLFVLFCAYTCLLCVFSLAVLGVMVLIVGQGSQPEACQLNGGDHVATVALATMSIMFGLFTCCMACDQLHAASTNQTKIDRMKGEVHDIIDGINELFGGERDGRCRWHWMVPVPARFPQGDTAAKIFGYYCLGRGDGGRTCPGSGNASVAGSVNLGEYAVVAGSDVAGTQGRRSEGDIEGGSLVQGHLKEGMR